MNMPKPIINAAREASSIAAKGASRLSGLAAYFTHMLDRLPTDGRSRTWIFSTFFVGCCLALIGFSYAMTALSDAIARL